MKPVYGFLSNVRTATLCAMCVAVFFARTAFTQDNPAQLGGPAKKSLRDGYSAADYQNFLRKERNGEILRQGGLVRPTGGSDVLVNNNTGATGTSSFTQSETTILAFGDNVVVGFNDAGSNAGGTNRFTGFSYSADGGLTFTDGGSLPANAIGDAGDPVMARDETIGRIYFSTLGFTTQSVIQVWRSDDNGITWMPPVNATPGGGTSQDKQWLAVDNFVGAGNGNVYLVSRDFGAPNGIYMYRSIDHGATFSPSGGTLIASGSAGNVQGAFVAVGPDHSVYAFYLDDGGNALKVRKSTDLGLTFAPAVTITGILSTGTNGDLGLTGVRQGTVTPSGFRSNTFPHVAINPVSGNIYVTYDDNPAGADKADVYLTQSTDGGATWTAPVTINDDGTTTDQWQPAIAVTPDGTGIGIFYYSRQEDIANNNMFKYYGRTGIISGSSISFLPSTAISDVASLPEFGRDAVINSVYMGDYNHASATPYFFHVVWSDNRDDLAGGAGRKDPNVYYKKIQATLPPGPNIYVSPSNLNFGNIMVGQTGGPTTVTIQNIGDADLTINSIGSPAADFSTANLPSLPLVLPSLATATLTVSFSPLSSGVQNSSFNIVSDALNTPTSTVNVQGRGFVPAANDLCANAIAISCGESVNGNTADATYDNVATCDVTNTAPGLWYTVVGTGGLMSVSTCTAASYDTKLSVFSGTCGSLVCVGGNDDFCSTKSQVTWPSANGTVYHVLVHGSGSQTGTFTLTTSTCPALISVSPPSLSFTVPLNGTTTGMFDISNTAGAGAENLDWSIVSIATRPFSGVVKSPAPEVAYSNDGQLPLFQISDRTLQLLRSQNVSSDVVRKIEEMRDMAPEGKDAFFGKAESLLGKEEHTIHQLLFDHSMLSVGEQKKLVGSVDPPASGPTPGFKVSGHGGPDAFGYEWADSDEPGGPVFNWTDITSTGTSVTLGDDAGVSVSLPFAFSFYGASKTSVNICSNGYLTFGATLNAFTNATIPTAAVPNDIICPFWDDLNPTLGGTIHYLGSATQFVVQYTGIKRFNTTTPETFQVILNADGSIVYQYLDMQGILNSATLGVENSTGTDGLLVAFNTAYIHNNLAVRIAVPPMCGWFSSVAPGFGSVPPGGSQQVTIGVDATGLAQGIYNCDVKIYSNGVNASTVIVPAMLTVGPPPDPSGIVSDDFNTPTLKPFWTFVNPGNPSTLSMVGTGTIDARARIQIPDGASHDVWSPENKAPRLMQNCNNIDFEVEVKFDQPLTSQYQLQGIIVEQDANRYLRFDFVKDNVNTRLFVASFTGGTPTVVRDLPIPPGSPSWMRLKREGDMWTQSYSYDGVNFTSRPAFSNVLTVNKIGPFVGNAGYPEGTAPAFDGLIDYFFSTATPIVPEDGVTSGPSITQHPANKTVQAGQTAMFTVGATGTVPLSYQWQKNNADIGGATGTSYTTPPTALADNGATFRCIVSNSIGTVTSNSAVLTVTSPAPGSSIVSDDFNSASINTSLWTIINPGTPSTLGTVGTGTADARLSIAVPAGSSHDVWSPSNDAPRLMQPMTNTDFEVEVKFEQPMTAGYQIEGVIVQQDAQNYLRFGFVRDFTNTRLFAASFVGGVPTTRQDINITGNIGSRPSGGGNGVEEQGSLNPYSAVQMPDKGGSEYPPYIGQSEPKGGGGEPSPNDAPPATLYLRVKRLGNSWTQSYSTNGTTFIAGASFTHTLTPSSIGPYIGNAGFPASSSPAFSGLIDYFFNTAAPIVPEDGTTSPPVITTQPVNQSVSEGQSATFSVGATGSATLLFQWQKNNANIAGANNPSYNTPTATLGDNGSTFRCIVSNSSGTVTSNPATLTVTSATNPSGIFSDDFHTNTLDVRWETINPAPVSTFSLVGSGTANARLSVAVPAGSNHDVWSPANAAPRIMQPANNTDFELEAKFEQSMTAGYQIEGIIVEESPGNYIRFGFVRDPGTTRIFAASFVSNAATVRTDFGITQSNPLYVRVKRTGNTWLQSYSNNGSTYTDAGPFNHTLAVTKVGPYIGNAGFPSNTSPAFTGLVDYFFNRDFPIVPEDGAPVSPYAQPAMIIPDKFAMNPNYPNPFNPTTTISYGLPEPARISLKVYNTLGQEVAALAEGERPAGTFNVIWDGKNRDGNSVGSGVYLYRIVAVNAEGKAVSALGKMILMK